MEENIAIWVHFFTSPPQDPYSPIGPQGSFLVQGGLAIWAGLDPPSPRPCPKAWLIKAAVFFHLPISQTLFTG